MSVLTTFSPIVPNAVQQVVPTGLPTGGTFTLTFAGQTTAAIAYNADAAAVQAALEALSNVAPGDVVVSGPVGGPFEVAHAGAYAGIPVAPITATASLTGGTSPTVGTNLVVNPRSAAGSGAQISGSTFLHAPQGTPAQTISGSGSFGS